MASAAAAVTTLASVSDKEEGGDNDGSAKWMKEYPSTQALQELRTSQFPALCGGK